MRTRAAVVLALLATFVAPAEAARGTISVPRYNVVGTAIEITFTNTSDETITMPRVWRIGVPRTDQRVAAYRWTDAQRQLGPGETAIWAWDQREGCYGACESPPDGAVTPGPYAVAIGRSLQRFQIGQFFQVGFDHLSADETFTVFVNRADDIEQMTTEAAAEDKTLMVTGIVRDARHYNSAWNFTIGPGSIILAEVSIEVCDADPYYVQDHKRAWMGDRWCPWSSYVAAVGR